MKLHYFTKCKGLTLVELILSVSLLSVLAAASFGVLYWQAKTYWHIQERLEAMTEVTNTYMILYKTLKTWKRNSIVVPATTAPYKIIGKNKFGITQVFYYDKTTGNLLFNNAVIAQNIIAKFNWNFAEKIITGTLQKKVKQGNINIKMLAVKFVVYPRNK